MLATFFIPIFDIGSAGCSFSWLFGHRVFFSVVLMLLFICVFVVFILCKQTTHHQEANTDSGLVGSCDVMHVINGEPQATQEVVVTSQQHLREMQQPTQV